MLGVLGGADLKAEIDRSHLGAVTQAYSGGEFNVPSKLMNYLAVGLPVVASVRPESEAARIVNESGGGWVSDSADPTGFVESIVEAMASPEELTRRSQSGVEFAKNNLSVEVLAAKFEVAMADVTGSGK